MKYICGIHVNDDDKKIFQITDDQDGDGVDYLATDLLANQFGDDCIYEFECELKELFVKGLLLGFKHECDFLEINCSEKTGYKMIDLKKLERID